MLTFSYKMNGVKLKKGSVYLLNDCQLVWYLGGYKEHEVPVLYFYYIGCTNISASMQPNTFILANESDTLCKLGLAINQICSCPANPALVGRFRGSYPAIMGEVSSEYRDKALKFAKMNPCFNMLCA